MLITKFTQLFHILQNDNYVTAPINQSIINKKAYKQLIPLI